MKHKSIILTSIILLLVCIILTNPELCLTNSLHGLNIWFQKLIPSLFPFMVITNIIIHMNLTGSLVKFLNPVIGSIFQISSSGIFVIITGFLCGFPIGAHVISSLYRNKQLSKIESEYLLSFCNNIGPAYYLGFVLPLLGIKPNLIHLIGMYGIPLIYGLFIRYSIYNKVLANKNNLNLEYSFLGSTNINSFMKVFDEAIWNGLHSITGLGGYVIFFNVLVTFPEIIFSSESTLLIAFSKALIEISTGISYLSVYPIFITLCLLPFGGLCCLAQTYCMLQQTDLSMKKYIIHKLIQTGITVFYYSFVALVLK